MPSIWPQNVAAPIIGDAALLARLETSSPTGKARILPPASVAPPALQSRRLELLDRRLYLGRQIRHRMGMPRSGFDDPSPEKQAQIDAFKHHLKQLTDDESHLLRAPFSATATSPPHRLVERIYRPVPLPILSPAGVLGQGRDPWGDCDNAEGGICVETVTAEELKLRELADEARAEGNRQRNARKAFVDSEGVDGFRDLYQQRRGTFTQAAETFALTSAAEVYARESGIDAAGAAAAARGRGYATDALAAYLLVRAAREGDYEALVVTTATYYREFFITSLMDFTTWAWPGVQNLLFVPIQEFMAEMSAWTSRELGQLVGVTNLADIGSAEIGVFIFVCQIGFEFLAVPFMQWFYGDDADKARWVREASAWAKDEAMSEFGFDEIEADAFVEGQHSNMEYGAGRFYEVLDDAIGGECSFTSAACYTFSFGQLDACPNCIDVAIDIAQDHVSRPLKDFLRDELRGILLEGSIGEVGRRAEYGFTPPGGAVGPVAPPYPVTGAGGGRAPAGGGGVAQLLMGGGLLYAALQA